MPDPIDSSNAINVGDAVLRFLGDTTDLERAWTALEDESTEAAQRAVTKIGKLYDDLNIKGSAALRETAQTAQKAFEQLSASGQASIGDLIQAERRMLETQQELKQSLGDAIPVEVSDRIIELKLAYIELTGTTAEYEKAQAKLITSSEAEAAAARDAAEALEAKAAAQAAAAEGAVGAAYETLGITSTEIMKAQLVELEEAYATLASSGRASMAELVAAERTVIEAQVELKAVMGEVVPAETLNRLRSLELQYIGLTGTVEEFAIAQERLITVEAEGVLAAEASAKAAQEQTLAWAAAGKAALNESNEVSIANQKSIESYKALNAEKKSSGLLSNAGTIATGIAEYQAIMMLASGIQEAFKAAMDFDKAFAEVSTLIDTRTPEGVAQVEMLHRQLLELPPVLGDITDLTKAVYEALSAGIQPGEAVAFVAKTAELAKGALMDNFTAVKLVTTAMNAYGISVGDANKVTSALMATIQNGKLRGPELADSIGRVIPIAAALKVSLAELLGASDALTAGGVSAEISMTELRQVLSTIEKPSKQAETEMGKLGTSFSAIRAEIRDKGLLVALQDLGARLDGNDEATSKLFGNVRALGGIFSLTGAQAAVYKKDVDAIKTAYDEGTAAQLAMQKVTESQSGQWETFGNTLKTKFLDTWSKISPIGNEIGRALKDITFNSGILQIAVVALVYVFTALAVVLGTTAALIDGLKAACIDVGYRFEELRGFVHAYSGTAEEFNAHLASMKKAMEDADAAARANGHGVHEATIALHNFLNGIDPAKEASDKFAASQKKLAEATDEYNKKAKESADASDADKKAKNDEKDRLERLAEAAKKATKEMEAYAKAHNIPIAEEMQKATDKARQFYEMLVRTHAPIESQDAALRNYLVTLSQYKSMLGDNRTYIQFIMDLARGKDKIVEVNTDLGKALTTKVTDPVNDAYKNMLQAQNNLGIESSAKLADYAATAVKDLQSIRIAYGLHLATLGDVKRAEEGLDKANKDLARSMGIDVRTAMEKVLNAEEVLNTQGSNAMAEHVKNMRGAFQDLMKLAKDNPDLVSLPDLQHAELNLLKADMELKIQLGKPIDQAAYNSIIKLTAAQKSLHDQMQRNEQIDTQWEQFWHSKAPSTAANMKNMAEMGKSAVLDFASAFGQAVAAVESGQESIGKAVEQAVAQTLISISSQAAVYALMYAADAIVAAVTGDEAAAALYATAAGEYAVVAAVAGAAGAMMSGGGGSSGAGASTSGNSTTGATQGVVGPVGAQNVQRFAEGGLVSQPTLAIIGDSKSSVTKGSTEGVLPLGDPEAMAAFREGLGGIGGDQYHVYVKGLVSADTLSDVMDQISTRVQAGGKLVASHANRVVKKS